MTNFWQQMKSNIIDPFRIVKETSLPLIKKIAQWKPPGYVSPREKAKVETKPIIEEPRKYPETIKGLSLESIFKPIKETIAPPPEAGEFPFVQKGSQLEALFKQQKLGREEITKKIGEPLAEAYVKKAPKEMVIPAVKGFLGRPIYEKIIKPSVPEKWEEPEGKIIPAISGIAGWMSAFGTVSTGIGKLMTMSPIGKTLINVAPKVARGLQTVGGGLTLEQLHAPLDATIEERSKIFYSGLPKWLGWGVAGGVPSPKAWLPIIFGSQYASAKLEGKSDEDSFKDALTMTAVFSLFKILSLPKDPQQMLREQALGKLGLKKGATPTEIRTAYHKLSHKYHPDLPIPTASEAKFKEISGAYEILNKNPAQVQSDIFSEVKDFYSYLRSPEGRGRALTIIKDIPVGLTIKKVKGEPEKPKKIKKTIEEMMKPEIKVEPITKGVAPEVKPIVWLKKEGKIVSGKNIPVIRYATPQTEVTDSFRGGTWYSTPESKTYDFSKDFKGLVGGPKEFKKVIDIKNPLVLPKAEMEIGSSNVIEMGFEEWLPIKERKLANELEEKRFDIKSKDYNNLIQKILTANGNTLGEINLVLKSKNKGDAAMDLIISKGLKKEGYDALILENEYPKGKIIDRHIFKFAEIKPKPEVKPIEKGETRSIEFFKGQDVPITRMEGTAKRDRIAKSIQRGEEVLPIEIDEEGFVLDGIHRLSAYRKLKYKDIPVKIVKTMAEMLKPSKIKPKVPKAEIIPTKAEIKPREEIKAIKEEAKPEVKPIPEELESLAVEARKYKSAEEFKDAFVIKEGKEAGLSLERARLLSKAESAREAMSEYIRNPKFSEMISKLEKLDKQFKDIGIESLEDFYTQATKEVKEVEVISKEVKITPIKQIISKFEETGTADIAVGKDYGISIKDEGEGFTRVIFGPNKLTKVGEGIQGTRSFSTKEEAFKFVKEVQDRITKAIKPVREVKPKAIRKPKTITQLRKEIRTEIKTEIEQKKFLKNLKEEIEGTIEKNNLQRTKELLKFQTEIEKEVFKRRIGKASIQQMRETFKIAQEKALITPEGKSTSPYRRLAKSMTGKSRMKEMTRIEIDAFIKALKGMPEPHYKDGKLIPPSIPRTTKIVPRGFFRGMKFREPNILRLLTPQSYYSQILGVKPLVEPLELAKQRFDLVHRDMANGTDKMIKIIDQVGKTSFKEKAMARIKNVPTKAISEMRDLLDKYEEAPASLSLEKKEIFNWFRNLNREMLRAENEVRAKLDIEPIKYRKAYVRHTADAMAQEMLEGKYPFPEGLKYWSGKLVGKKIFNPMEIQRKLSDDLEKLWTRDLAHATKSMLWIALKEIHLSQPLKAFNELLGAVSKDLSIYRDLSPEEQEIYDETRVIPASTKRWLIDYVNQVIKGQETDLDASVNRIVTNSGLSGLLNKVLAPFGRAVGRKPVTNMFQVSGRVMIHGVMGPLRPKQLIRNKFQLTQNLALYTLKANLKGFYPASIDKTLKNLLDKSLFLKTYTGVEELPQNLQGKLEKANLAAFQWTAVSNVSQAMKVAYWDTLDLIVNPKYKEFGWADPARTYDEPKGHLYPSEREKLLKEMEFGAGITQYHYIAMGMPEVFRHKALVPLTRLQSWWMNYFFKFNREAIYRALKGETGYGAKIPWSRRIGWLRYLILGGMILNTLGYERSYLWGAAPTGTPPTAQFITGLYTYLTTLDDLDDDWGKKKNTQAKKQMYYAMKTFVPGYLAWKDFIGLWSGEKSWKDYFFYTKKKEEAKPIKIKPIGKGIEIKTMSDIFKGRKMETPVLGK